jgi:hypothetical protein
MAGLGKQTRGNGIARVGLSKGGYADMSEKHEGMESKAEEAREYAMEDKGYVETKSGKMKKADMLTKKMPVKKKGKMMKGKR